MTTTRTWRTPEVVQITGATPRQIHRWATLGIIPDAVPEGSGRWHRWTLNQLYLVAALAQVARVGGGGRGGRFTEYAEALAATLPTWEKATEPVHLFVGLDVELVVDVESVTYRIDQKVEEHAAEHWPWPNHDD